MSHRKRFLFRIFFICAYFTVGLSPSRAVDIGSVMPAALDQPRINILFKTTPDGTPIKDIFGLDWFMDDPYLDTGASGIMLSQFTSMVFDLQTKLSRYPEGTGPLVVYQDVGVGGTQDFNVSTPLYIGIAKYHPDVDGTSTVPFTQTTGPVRLQMTPEDNPDLGPIDVVGMPAMIGKVVVMDPKPADNLFDTMQTYIYDPGTPFNPAAINSEPGIPATNHHVKLSYASFDQFTNVTPEGAPGPTLAASPFIGPNPVTGGSADTPGVTVEFAGQRTTGSFLFDTGASTTMISSSLAEKLQVRYRPGTEGTADPILEHFDSTTSQWSEIADQFTLPVGGVGGIVTAAGFFLDDMLIRTIEGNAANDNDPNHLKFLSTPVLVNDITLRDPNTNEMLTLDGIFGVNNLVANAMIIPGDPIPSIYNLTLSNFNWVVFDQPNGLLGLDVKPPISGWTGGGSSELYQEVYQSTDISWSNSYNWEGVSPGGNSANITLVFSQSTPASTDNFNDFPDGTPFKGITFNGAATFMLQGNRIVLTGDVINNSAAVQTIGLDLELSAAERTFAANTCDIVVSGRISGNQSLAKMGANKLILTSANTYTGETDIREGTLTLDGGDLADASAVHIADGAVLEIVSGTPTLGTIDGRGAVAVSGSGTILTASSISAKTLTIGTIAASAWTGGGNPADSHWSNPSNWGGSAPKSYDSLKFGELTPASVANSNDYAADTSFSGIVFSGDSAFTLQGNRVMLDGNIVNGSSQPQTIGLDVQLAGMARTFSADTADIIVSGQLSGGEGLIKSGAAKLILTSANTYTGDTAIRQGTLILDGADLADASTINIAAGAELKILSGAPPSATSPAKVSYPSPDSTPS